jgi:hypothetical protein
VIKEKFTYRNTVFLLSLGILEYFVFSVNFSWFFQGDALFWMSHRFQGWGEFLQSLYSLDVANWYRPLSNRTIPSLFFPFFGLGPYGYHWVVFVLFFACTCLVFHFLRRLTSDFTAAAIGTVFFSIHSINVYVTYDFAFAPELLYATFYVASCAAFLRTPAAGAWYGFSIASFVLSLMSKEAAVTLPLNLALLSLLATDARPLKHTLPFFGIAVAYYLYVVRYLGVGAGDYAVSFHKDILWRPLESLLWAFHFTGLQAGAIQHLVYYLLFVAAFAVITAAILLSLSAQWKPVVLGAGWFFLALAPMIGIVAYFGLYYLFLPMVGMSLVVGVSIRSVPWRVAQALLLAVFVLAAVVNTRSSIASNTALGYSGRIAERSARDMKAAYSALPAGTTFYIVNPKEPDLWRYYGLSALMRLVYADPSIEVFYSSLGHTVPEKLLQSDTLVVMRYANGGLEDITAGFKQNPAAYVSFQTEDDFRYVTSDRFDFQLAPARVAAGRDSYTIRIRGAEDSSVELQYRYNEGPLAYITVHLNPAGETSFFVSAETKRGRYRFVGMRTRSDSPWIKVDGTVEVTE